MSLATYNNDYELMPGLLSLKGTWSFNIHGESMRPFIRPTDVIECVNACYSDVMIGDVLVYKTHDKLIVHRVIRKRMPNILIMKGDNCVIMDFPVTSDQLVGIVVRVIHGKQEFIYKHRFWKLVNYFVALASFYVNKYKVFYKLFMLFGKLIALAHKSVSA